MAIERFANLDYCMWGKETTKGVAVTPTITVPMYSETMAMNPNTDRSQPIIGIKAATHRSYMGQHDMTGNIVVLAEPNTLGYAADMLLTKTSTTGAGPYTHTFALSTTTNPNSYTVDILRGQVVYRFIGLEVSDMAINFNKNMGEATLTCSARGYFAAGAITNVAGSVLTLDSTYNATPTNGLVVGDLVRLFLAAGTTVDTTVSAVTATTVTVASAGGAAANDVISLRPQTPALSILDPILWARSEYRFGATAAAALSAAHTPIEDGSGHWKITHSFKDAKGEKRSGSFYPASLIRTTGDVSLATTQFFDSPTTERDFLQLAKNALVARHFVQGTTYEVQLTLNNLRAIEKPNDQKNDTIIYDRFTWRPEYDPSDAQMMKLVIINNIPTI